MAEKTAYSQAAHTGKYEKSLGLLGKYDNVRRFWEDQVTGIFLRPALNKLVERKKRHLERLRILDLGCGSGDGYDLLMNVTTKDPGIYEYITEVITPDVLKEYVGLDINKELLKQAEAYYGHIPKVRFMQGDLSDGLPGCVKEQEAFDVYFTSYGTLSHFHDHENIKIISDICKHAADGAILVGDWLGRYSYEWQDLWPLGQDQEYFMDYRISYIYPENQRGSVDIESFPLRLMTRDEIERIIHQAAKESGTEIRTLKFFERSLLVGRHMDTAEYNKNCPKIRQAVNSLFEGYLRTDLESLFVDYVPLPGFDHLNNFFEMFFMTCNALVQYTISMLSKYNAEVPEVQGALEVLPFYPEPLKEAMRTMRRVIEGVAWISWGDVRANVIEPHLGFALRKLEMDLQPATGVGHGLIGVFEIRK